MYAYGPPATPIISKKAGGDRPWPRSVFPLFTQQLSAPNHTAAPTGHASSELVMKEAIRSATIIVGRFVFAAGMDGMIEASTTRSRAIPCTRPAWSTTAAGSPAGPMRHVPTGWWYVLVRSTIG